jgi:hypothetical protein
MAFEPGAVVTAALSAAPRDALRTAFRHASPWLLQTSRELVDARTAHCRDLCNAVMGCFVITQVLEILTTDDPSLDLLSGLKHDLSAALDVAVANTELTGGDINLLILAGRILTVEGVPSGSLQHVCDGVLNELNTPRSGRGPAGEAPFLMHALGFPITPSAETDVERTADRTALDAGDRELSRLAAQIERETLWGTRDVATTPGRAWILDLLGGLAAHRYKNNSLLMANRLLRAYDYRCARGCGASSSRSDLYSLLLAMQRNDGSFGWLGSEATRLARLSCGAVSAKYALYLPVTVDCLWTLAECSSLSWRLVSSAGQAIEKWDDID